MRQEPQTLARSCGAFSKVDVAEKQKPVNAELGGFDAVVKHEMEEDSHDLLNHWEGENWCTT